MGLHEPQVRSTMYAGQQITLPAAGPMAGRGPGSGVYERDFGLHRPAGYALGRESGAEARGRIGGGGGGVTPSFMNHQEFALRRRIAAVAMHCHHDPREVALLWRSIHPSDAAELCKYIIVAEAKQATGRSSSQPHQGSS